MCARTRSKALRTEVRAAAVVPTQVPHPQPFYVHAHFSAQGGPATPAKEGGFVAPVACAEGR
jgi:hypothetical protein